MGKVEPMNDISVLIPTSPIASHPSTALIEKCMASVRKHLPDAPIFVMIDGVREEQRHYTERYIEYIRNLVTRVDFSTVTFVPFVTFTHQAAMTRKTLEMVKTPLILFMEHDTFFLDGLPIDFAGIRSVITSGALNMVQFHCQWEPWIIPEHQHLMLDRERVYFDGVPMVRTWQFSARPHVASADFYRGFLKAYFSANCRTFIEDRMSEVIFGVRSVFGDDAWESWKLAYYAPTEGDTIRRTWTDDGRAGDKKFPMTY